MVNLIGKHEVKSLFAWRAVPAGPADEKLLRNLSKKEVALRSQGLVVTDAEGNVVFDSKKKYAQHFFPLSVRDYAEAVYALEKLGSPLPILSVDSHDVLKCDFHCQDCLSGGGRKIPVGSYPPGNFNLPLEFYQHMLREIAEYSARRDFTGVRFEQSGEGNPDFYKFRPELLRFAKQLGMGSVYVTTGSKMDATLRQALVENADFIRISFPGIGNSAYEYYSGQGEFTYDDSLANIEKIVADRRKAGREKDLLLGARVALRSGHEAGYLGFAERLRETGVDAVQVVKILVPEGAKPEDFPITPRAIEQLKAMRAFDRGLFSVNLPHTLDSMYYSREIRDRTHFPKQCFSARVQPVLAGRSLSVCTKSEVMYSPVFLLGTFQGVRGELEKLLAGDNVNAVTKDVPGTCRSCSNIYDNLLMHSLQTLIRSNGKLKFYEAVR